MKALIMCTVAVIAAVVNIVCCIKVSKRAKQIKMYCEAEEHKRKLNMVQRSRICREICKYYDADISKNEVFCDKCPLNMC